MARLLDSDANADAQKAQRQSGDRRARALPKPTEQIIRSGSLVKLKGCDKKYDGQMGRVADTNVKFERQPDGLVSVLLAPKGNSQGVWVAVAPEYLTVQV